MILYCIILCYIILDYIFYICSWNVALYGSETWTLRKNEQRVVNAFETRGWRRMLKIKWTDRVKNGEVFRSAKEERLFLKIKKKIDATHG